MTAGKWSSFVVSSLIMIGTAHRAQCAVDIRPNIVVILVDDK
jgi:hypothetical protein